MLQGYIQSGHVQSLRMSLPPAASNGRAPAAAAATPLPMECSVISMRAGMRPMMMSLWRWPQTISRSTRQCHNLQVAVSVAWMGSKQASPSLYRWVGMGNADVW